MVTMSALVQIVEDRLIDAELQLAPHIDTVRTAPDRLLHGGVAVSFPRTLKAAPGRERSQLRAMDAMTVELGWRLDAGKERDGRIAALTRAEEVCALLTEYEWARCAEMHVDYIDETRERLGAWYLITQQYEVQRTKPLGVSA